MIDLFSLVGSKNDRTRATHCGRILKQIQLNLRNDRVVRNLRRHVYDNIKCFIYTTLFIASAWIQSGGVSKFNYWLYNQIRCYCIIFLRGGGLSVLL
jgi:hypothetical protein